MLDEPGKQLHPARLERAFGGGDVGPGLEGVGARGELRARRDHAAVELAAVDALPVGIPAVVELPPVAVGPLGGHVVRPVDRPGREIEEERLVGGVGAAVVEPAEGLVDEILGEMLPLSLGRLDRVEVAHQPGLPLRRLAGEEAVEMIEPVAGRPAVFGADGRRFGDRGVVPLAESAGPVAVVAEDLGDGRRRLRDHAGVAVEGDGALGDRAGADARVVAAGEQRRARRGADARGVEAGVADPGLGEARQRGRTDLAAERLGDAEADVVEEDHDDVGSVGGDPARRLRPDRLGILEPLADDARQRRIGKRKHVLCRRPCRRDHAPCHDRSPCRDHDPDHPPLPRPSLAHLLILPVSRVSHAAGAPARPFASRTIPRSSYPLANRFARPIRVSSSAHAPVTVARMIWRFTRRIDPSPLTARAPRATRS